MIYAFLLFTLMAVGGILIGLFQFLEDSYEEEREAIRRIRRRYIRRAYGSSSKYNKSADYGNTLSFNRYVAENKSSFSFLDVGDHCA